jgi:hypothetical protein
MKRRSRFTESDAAEIRQLLNLKCRAERPNQKRLRDGLRDLGFYISDWHRSASGFTPADFDELVRSGDITIAGRTAARLETKRPATPEAASEEVLARAAIEALSGSRHKVNAARVAVPATPGLYAIYGSADTWRQLGLGFPPDGRPLYVGKAERSLVSRDLETHFGDGRTGSSTLRRSFAALLRTQLGLRGIPRNPDKPERPANYGLSAAHDKALTEWMRRRLLLAVWPKPPSCSSLLAVEREVLSHWRPPLNLADVETDWRARVSDARKVMADDARAWARARGVAL